MYTVPSARYTMNRHSAASCFITRSKDKDDRRGNGEKGRKQAANIKSLAK